MYNVRQTQRRSHGISDGGARLRNFGPFFPNYVLIVNSYTDLVSFGRGHIKDTFSRRNNH